MPAFTAFAYGGLLSESDNAKQVVASEATNFWAYPIEKEKEWKWMHTDLILKEWFRQVGKTFDFDFLYSYEYDMLFMKPLSELYPTITQSQIALAACEPFTEAIENRWRWTGVSPWREDYQKFKAYMKEKYNLGRQQNVCLGPGPLLSRAFLEKWSETEDIDLVSDEIAYPAYAEALGFESVNNNLHPGFGDHPGEKYFSCESTAKVTNEMIEEQMGVENGVRAFHPVKHMITFEEARAWL